MSILNLQAIKVSLEKKNDQQLMDILYYTQDDYDKSVIPIIGTILTERGFSNEDITKANESYLKLISNISTSKETTGIKAGFWIRLCNYILDHLIFYFVIANLVQYVLKYTGDLTQNSYYETVIIAFIAYYTITIWAFGATIGMLVIGLKVVDNNNNRPDLFISSARGVFMLLNYLILSIGHLWIFGKNKSTLIDSLSGTKIIYKR